MATIGTTTRSGQTIVFFMMVLVILVFVVLWNFDLHKILYVKSKSQNAGDAAALMASRWQAITLNLIGDLNIMHALALGSQDTMTASSITNIQARLCYVGPMIAFMAAQQAAKNNGIYSNSEFTQKLRTHADKVRYDYPSMISSSGEMLYPQPYDNCWQEYADMLDLIADEGVAAGPDNARLYSDYTGGHTLLMIDFYEAVAGFNWCWFYHNSPYLLEDYENFFPNWWDALPHITRRHVMNSEIFGLGLTKIWTRLSNFVDYATLTDAASERDFDIPNYYAMVTGASWYVYQSDTWSSWDAMSTTSEDPFPAAGPVKPRFDYAGADAVIRIEARTDRLTPGPGGSSVRDTITWTAAAKPFGYLNDEDRPTFYRLVLPAFRDVRLIPVDSSSRPSGGAYNLAWRRHIENHLPVYMGTGPGGFSCWYCQQLVVWENETFRQTGTDWLSSNSWQCTISVGGGGSRGGGRRSGH